MRLRNVRLGVALIAGGLAAGLAAGYLGTTGHVTRVAMLAIILLPIALWRRPYIGPAVLMSAAILVEQSGQVPAIPVTQRIPLFEAIGPGHLQGADILLLTILLISVIKRHELGLRWWPRSHISAAIGTVMLCVVLAIVVGRHNGGHLRISLMESRPYVYLAAAYLLTAALAGSDSRAIPATLWAFVGSVGFKAVQGLYVWVGHRHMYPKPEAYISHEASYFFVIFVVLVLALWMFHHRGRLRTVATSLLPLVVGADVVNDRRVAWAMLVGALLCLGVIVYQTLPSRRRLLGKSVVALVLISVVYFPVMWNSTSSLAQPARALKSQFKPSLRDASSDVYRVQEDANLQLNIKQAGLLGNGFGVKIDYALPITDISSIDPEIPYIPHNDVLDVMMRMGLLGSIAMWLVIGTGMIAGIRLARHNRVGVLAVLGATAASALVAYAVMGAEDQGFFMFRLAFITGVLLGLVEAAHRLSGVGARPPQGSRVAAGAERLAPFPRPGTEPLPRPLTASVLAPVAEPASRRPIGIVLAPVAAASRRPPGPVLAPATEPASRRPRRSVLAPVIEPVPAAGDVDAPPHMTRNFAALFGGQLVTWTMTLVWTLIVPRVLGPNSFGILTAALSAGAVFALMLGLGTRNYLVREIVMHRERAAKLVGTAIALRLALSPLVVLAAFAFARLAHYGHELTTALYLATAMNILLLLNEPLLAMFQAIERMKYMAFTDMINKAAQSLGGIAVVLIGLGAIAVTANMAVVAALVIVLNLNWLRPYLRIDLKTTFAAMARMTRESLNYWATSVFFTIYLWVDTIMLSTMTPTKVVGWYGAATTLFQTLMFLPTLLATTWLPRLVHAYRGGRPALARTARKPLELVLVISAPVSACTIMAASLIVRLLYGSAYTHAVSPLMILGLCLAPTYMNIIMSQVLIAEGRQVVFKWLMLAATIVNPLLNLGLITVTQTRYHNGAIGAALALLVTELLVAAGAFIAVRRMFTRDGFRRWALALVASAAACGVAVLAHPLGGPASLAAGLATVVALVLVLRVPTEEEWAFVIGGVRRLRSSRPG